MGNCELKVGRYVPENHGNWASYYEQKLDENLGQYRNNLRQAM
jgi:hypothetical protein